MTRLNRLLEPIRHARDTYAPPARRHTSLGIGGMVLVGLLVALGIWAWPEIQRTIRMHRM